MERDFFGLSSKNGAGTMKEDATNKPKDPVFWGSGMQWSFSNKVSALPQLLSFKGTTQEDRPRKTIDPLASSGYMTIPTADAFDSNQKPFLGVIQKNLSIGKQAGIKHGVTVYPVQSFDAHSACNQESRIFSVTNQSNQVSPVLQSCLATTRQNMVNSAIKPRPLGSKTSGTPVSVLPSIGSNIVGSTDLRSCSKSSGTPAQLTIFYAGSVCVYDDISPEKAQAIMLLAGNGSTPNPIQNMTVSTTKLLPPIPIPSKDDGFINIGQSYTVSTTKLLPPIPMPSKDGGFINIGQSYPSPLRTSPLPVTSQPSSQPGGASSATPGNHLESPNVVGSLKSAVTKMVRPGLPQARKASLARFLEKRKERVMSNSPYYMSKKSPECGSEEISFSMNSTDSCPLPAIN